MTVATKLITLEDSSIPEDLQFTKSDYKQCQFLVAFCRYKHPTKLKATTCLKCKVYHLCKDFIDEYHSNHQLWTDKLQKDIPLTDLEFSIKTYDLKVSKNKILLNYLLSISTSPTYPNKIRKTLSQQHKILHSHFQDYTNFFFQFIQEERD